MSLRGLWRAWRSRHTHVWRPTGERRHIEDLFAMTEGVVDIGFEEVEYVCLHCDRVIWEHEYAA